MIQLLTLGQSRLRIQNGVLLMLFNITFIVSINESFSNVEIIPCVTQLK